MECLKWVHPAGAHDPLLQLSITPVIRKLPIDFSKFQLRHLGLYQVDKSLDHLWIILLFRPFP